MFFAVDLNEVTSTEIWQRSAGGFPLTAEAIRCIVGMMLSGRYRSTENYISRARVVHSKGYEWTTQLGREALRAGRACRRGKGPTHRTAELPITECCIYCRSEAWKAHHYTMLKAEDAYHIGFDNYLESASVFILREIEAPTMLAKSVNIDERACTCHLMAPGN